MIDRFSQQAALSASSPHSKEFEAPHDAGLLAMTKLGVTSCTEGPCKLYECQAAQLTACTLEQIITTTSGSFKGFRSSGNLPAGFEEET